MFCIKAAVMPSCQPCVHNICNLKVMVACSANLRSCPEASAFLKRESGIVLRYVLQVANCDIHFHKPSIAGRKFRAFERLHRSPRLPPQVVHEPLVLLLESLIRLAVHPFWLGREPLRPLRRSAQPRSDILCAFQTQQAAPLSLTAIAKLAAMTTGKTVSLPIQNCYSSTTVFSGAAEPLSLAAVVAWGA